MNIFEQTFEGSPDSLIIVDSNGKIEMVNQQVTAMFGYERKELTGKPIEVLIPKRYKKKHVSYRNQYIKQPHLRQMSEGIELFGLRKDEIEIPIDVMLSPMMFEKETKILCVVRDVTDNTHASQYVRSLIEASLDPLVTINPDGKITDVNEATIKVTGVSREDLIGTDFSNYFTEPEKAREGYQQVFAKGSVIDYPLTICHKNGKLTDVLYNASIYKDAAGEVLGVFAAARDVTEQNQASQYARSLIEASLDPLVTISADGIITDVNEATIKVTGTDRENLIGTDFSNYFTEPKKAREGYQQVFAKGSVTDYPLTIRHKLGHLIDVLYNATVYKDVFGNVLGVFAAARDVTVQNQASQYARSLLEASLDPLVTISPSGIITDVNEATVKVTGIDKSVLVGTDFADYFTDPDEAREGYRQAFAKGFVMDYALTIRHKEGKLTDVLYNASVYKDTKGKVLGVFAAARDVTEQKQASQYARSLIEASLDPLVTISPEGKITDVNEATIKATGLNRNDLIGTDFSNYFTEPDKAREGYQQVFAKGSVTDYPLTIRHKKGRLTDVLYNASVYKDVRGNVLGVFAAARDVTESKRVMRELAETQNFLDNILQSSTKISIIGKDLDYKILSWNEGAKRNYGYEEKDITGKSSDILHTPEDLESGAVKQMLNTALKEGLAEGEFTRVRKDGTRFAASVVITRRNNTAGKPIGFLLMSNDISEKKQAEERLKHASQYARSLIEASLDPLVTISPEGKITDVNEATIKVTGVEKTKLVGTDFADYFTEPDKARDGYQQAFARGFVTDYALTIRHNNGKLTDVLYNASVYKDSQGNVLGVFAAARDVTEQKQASQYARSLIEASLDPLVTISPEGIITDVNQATVDVTGVSKSELVGTDFADYFTEPDKAREGYQQAFARGFVTDYALTIRHKIGKLTDVLYNASVYKNLRGDVLGVFAAARDVTEQKQASQYARSLIEASLDPLVTISPEGKITDVNEATIKVTGVSRDELIGTDFSNYFTEPEKAREGYQQVFAKGSVTDYPLTIRHKKKQKTYVLYNASVYKDVEGKVLGVFAAARDVTAQKEAEAEVAEQRSKELDRLVELERFRELTVGRELRMIELKKQIEELKQQFQTESED